MHIKDNIYNFLFDQEYSITIYENHIYLHSIYEITKMDNNIMEIKTPKMQIIVLGDDLKVLKMTKEEIMIKGTMQKIEYLYV